MIDTKSTGTKAKVKVKDVQTKPPTNIESNFEYEELFFSITDPKSKITFANETFIRISKFEPDEIIGQLHKVVRHPDMPRSVFYIFWNILKQRKPVAAYVKNLSKDGSFYWVLALALPCKEGYLSIRLKPGSSLFQTVKNFYKETLKYEKELEIQTDKKNAMLAAEKYLLQLLNKEGFSSYEEFMREALQREMHHRENELQKRKRKNRHDASVVPSTLTRLEKNLTRLFLSTDNLKKIQENLLEHSDYILKLARSILLISINAQVSSSKLDQNELSLSVVAEKMGEQTLLGEQQLVKLKENIFGLSSLINLLNFGIISSKLQLEIEIYFKQEFANNSSFYNNFELPPDVATSLLSD
ncbi:MAG: PAS domain-containing protein, partial [Balneolales bacterium]|nr:PAS domain-containing protein [Balneolales bacterium]